MRCPRGIGRLCSWPRSAASGAASCSASSEGTSICSTAPSRSGLSGKSRAAVRKAKEKIHPFVDDATQQQLDGLIATLVAAGPDDEAEACAALEHVIREHSYLL